MLFHFRHNILLYKDTKIYIAVIGKKKLYRSNFFTIVSSSKQACYDELDMYLIRKVFLISNI